MRKYIAAEDPTAPWQVVGDNCCFGQRLTSRHSYRHRGLAGVPPAVGLCQMCRDRFSSAGHPYRLPPLTVLLSPAQLASPEGCRADLAVFSPTHTLYADASGADVPAGQISRTSSCGSVKPPTRWYCRRQDLADYATPGSGGKNLLQVVLNNDLHWSQATGWNDH